MVNSPFQLQIPKRNNQCAKGGERLQPGMAYYSLLIEQEEILNRKDFCSSCWSQLTLEERRGSHSYWKSRIDERKAPTPPQSRPLRALSLIKTLLQQSDANQAEIFVLALYLAHARLLILRKEFEQDGDIYLLYEIARQDEFLTVKRVDLTNLETDEIQQALAPKLNAV